METSKTDILYADASETSTIDSMIQGIKSLEQFSAADMQAWTEVEVYVNVGVPVARSLRNFASYVVHEEAFLAESPSSISDLNENSRSGDTMQQLFLCIRNRCEGCLEECQGSWTKFMGQSPGFRRVSVPPKEAF